MIPMVAQRCWKIIRGPHFVQKLPEGMKFIDQKLVENDTQEGRKSAA